MSLEPVSLSAVKVWVADNSELQKKDISRLVVRW